MIGKTISHYVVLRRLGQGGMGEVFLAEDTLLERKVALKFLATQPGHDEAGGRRFLEEAKAAAAIDHPYVCKIYEAGEAEGRAFIGMEFVEGETLQARLERTRVPLPVALQITLEISEALVRAHASGVVHRDLKPANKIGRAHV